MGPSVGMPGGGNGVPDAFGGMSSVPNFLQQNMPLGQQGGMPANPVGQAGPSPEVLQQQVQIIQMLQAQGVPQDQWAAVLSVMMSTGAVGGVANNAAQPYGQNPGYGGNDPSRDRSGYNEIYGQRSPSGRYRNRSRSRSPGHGFRRDNSPPRRRDSPTYGAYGRDGRGRGGGAGGRDFRQRSPDRSRRSASPLRGHQSLPPPGPRNIEYDRTLPPNHIKGTRLKSPPLHVPVIEIVTNSSTVLSRTLFVGGVTLVVSFLGSVEVANCADEPVVLLKITSAAFSLNLA